MASGNSSPAPHVMIAFGTRPEVIKMATVVHTLRSRHPQARVTVCATGQHREMMHAACNAFDLKPDLDLQIMQPGQTPTEVLGRLLLSLNNVFAEYKPDVVAVQGDTMTVMAAALAGYLHRVRVAHVEAGLRTSDKFAPFPEEVNRRVTGVVADQHFVPTAASRENLLRENTPADQIFLTGNTVIDALYWMREKVKDRPFPAALAPRAPRLILVTAHRRESFGEPFRNLCLALRQIAERFPDVELIYPVHLNPNVQQPVREILGNVPRVRLIEPVDYADLVAFLNRATLVLTDSGGIQEEAPALGKPVLVLREKTERPEAVQCGAARLVGTDVDRIVNAATELLTDPSAYAKMSQSVSPYGDGRASERIADLLVLGRTDIPEFGS
jgi:UDP-N-acetylglucosamine 2-epimerase (non-hydrolysing)